MLSLRVHLRNPFPSGHPWARRDARVCTPAQRCSARCGTIYDCKSMEVPILNIIMVMVMLACHAPYTAMVKHPSVFGTRSVLESMDTWVGGCEQIRKTQDEPQWIVAQRLLSTLTIPGFS